MTREDVQLISVEFAPEGASITYLRKQDIRENGLMWQHQVLVPSESDYEEELETAHEAVLDLLLDALDDEDRVPVLEPLMEGDEEDEEDSDE